MADLDVMEDDIDTNRRKIQVLRARVHGLEVALQQLLDFVVFESRGLAEERATLIRDSFINKPTTRKP